MGQPHITAEPAKKTATLLAVNRRHTLPALAKEATSAVSIWLSVEIEHLSGCVLAQKGVIDLISVDHWACGRIRFRN